MIWKDYLKLSEIASYSKLKHDLSGSVPDFQNLGPTLVLSLLLE